MLLEAIIFVGVLALAGALAYLPIRDLRRNPPAIREALMVPLSGIAVMVVGLEVHGAWSYPLAYVPLTVMYTGLFLAFYGAYAIISAHRREMSS